METTLLIRDVLTRSIKTRMDDFFNEQGINLIEDYKRKVYLYDIICEFVETFLREYNIDVNTSYEEISSRCIAHQNMYNVMVEFTETMTLETLHHLHKILISIFGPKPKNPYKKEKNISAIVCIIILLRLINFIKLSKAKMHIINEQINNIKTWVYKN